MQLEESAETLRGLQSRLPDAYFVLMSDVFLEDMRVMSHLELLFRKYSTGQLERPAVIIMCGRFLNTPPPAGPKAVDEYRTRFAVLAKMIQKYAALVKHTKFVFCPSPMDSFSATQCMPLRPLPADVLAVFASHAIAAEFGSNPCRYFGWLLIARRMTFFTHETLVLRENVTTKLLPQSLLQPSQDSHLHTQVSRS